MKQIAAFLLLLTIILAAGYYSLDSADILIDEQQLEQATLTRDQEHIEENGFDPMAILSQPTNISIPSNYTRSRNIITAALLVLSRYDDSCECPASYADELSSSLIFNSNGYVYTEKFEYLNANNEVRYLDCIFTDNFFRIIYLRFYSQKEYSISPDDNLLEEFDKDSAFFYNSEIDDMYNYIDIIEEDPDYDETADPYDDFGFEYTIGESDDFEYIYEHLSHIYDSVHINQDSKLLNFWLKPCMLSTYCPYPSTGYDNIKLPLMTHIVEGILISSSYDGPEYSYSPSSGILYQEVRFGGNQLITIYNIAEDRIEGFFSPAYYNY